MAKDNNKFAMTALLLSAGIMTFVSIGILLLLDSNAVPIPERSFTPENNSAVSDDHSEEL